MRQLLIIAIIVAVAFAQAPAKNCSAIPQPAGSGNYYMPPKACVDTDASVRACITAFSDCVKVGKTCGAVNTCFAGRVACLIGTKSSSPNCTQWSSALDNAGLYLIAGGSYKDSTLERACEYGLCQGAKEAVRLNLTAANGDVCPVNFSSACMAPNFEAPTRAPGQAKFSIVFGGAAWTEVLKNAPKGSAEYKKLETAIGKGLAKLLGVLEHLITILDFRIGSLVVDFIVNDDSITPEAITAKIAEVKADPTLAGSTFSELATVSGVAIEVSGGGQADTDAPTPAGTTTAAPASAGAFSAIVAVVAVIAAMAF